jgi:ACS family tartrate transporter-like MFS transporter
VLRQPALAILSLALVPIGHCSSYGPFWSLPASFLTGSAAAGGIALVTSIAASGGFIGPAMIGFLKDQTGTHVAAFVSLAGCALIAAFFACGLRKVPLPQAQPGTGSW